MTSTTNEQQRVDVLAVMTEYIADCEYEMRNAETAKYEALCKKSMDKAKQARAAVAELIEAGHSFLENDTYEAEERFIAALASVGAQP